MKSSKLMQWVIRPAIACNQFYGTFPTFTFSDYEKMRKNITNKTKKIINIKDYYNSSTNPTIEQISSWHSDQFGKSPYYTPGWFQPLIIFLYDNRGHVWSFDSFYNGAVNWTIESGITKIPSDSGMKKFLDVHWSPY